MQTEKVHITKERESYLTTMYGKALDARVENSILGDTYAAEIVRKIDFDFDSLHLASGGAITLPMRAKHLDGWAREFLAAHPIATVLNLGCGLDSRVFRMDPGANVRWYDVDLPDVIELRRQLYPGRSNDYVMLATSVTDPHWLDSIPGDRPVMVVAEGLMQHLPKADAVTLLNRISQHFPSGQIIFDAYSQATANIMNFVFNLSLVRLKMTNKGAAVHLSWGVDDPRGIEKLAPRLKLVDAVSFLTMPELLERLSASSRYQRVVGSMMAHWGWYQRAMRHFRYEF